VDGRVDGVDESDLWIHLRQQRQAAVAGEVSTLKIGDDLTAVVTGEQEGLRGRVRHADGLSNRP